MTEHTQERSIAGAIRVIGAASPIHWSTALVELAKATGFPMQQLHAALIADLGLHNPSTQPRSQAQTPSGPERFLHNPDPVAANGLTATPPLDSVQP